MLDVDHLFGTDTSSKIYADKCPDEFQSLVQALGDEDMALDELVVVGANTAQLSALGQSLLKNNDVGSLELVGGALFSSPATATATSSSSSSSSSPEATIAPLARFVGECDDLASLSLDAGNHDDDDDDNNNSWVVDHTAVNLLLQAYSQTPRCGGGGKQIHLAGLDMLQILDGLSAVLTSRHISSITLRHMTSSSSSDDVDKIVACWSKAKHLRHVGLLDTNPLSVTRAVLDGLQGNPDLRSIRLEHFEDANVVALTQLLASNRSVDAVCQVTQTSQAYAWIAMYHALGPTSGHRVTVHRKDYVSGTGFQIMVGPPKRHQQTIDIVVRKGVHVDHSRSLRCLVGADVPFRVTKRPRLV